MILRRSDAPPHRHHVDLVQEVASDVRRHLDRLGRMRSLVVVQVGASGGYRISLIPAAEVRLNTLEAFGMGSLAAIEVIDDVFVYDAADEAAVLVVETNPIDGTLLTFLVQTLAPSR